MTRSQQSKCDGNNTFCGPLWERAKRKCEKSVSQIKTHTHTHKLGANHTENIHYQIAPLLRKNK